MAFVRFSRDNRGYEHVYLIEALNQRGKSSRTRVLYWFRTPPGIKVGREPFDADTQKVLEAQNPHVTFDWPRIIATPTPPPIEVQNWRERRRAERAVKRARATEAQLAPSEEFEEPAVMEPPVQVVEPRSEPGSSEPDSDVAEPVAATGPAPVPAAGSSGGAAGSGRRRRRRGGRRRRLGKKAQPNPPADSSNEG